MARPIWKGQISFGLVNIPVSVFSAERRADLSFKLIDSRNSARVRYERVNEETGEEVPWNKIIKGYEYDSGSYVLLTEKDLERASVEMTKTIEIEQFINLTEIESVYFDRPYYIVPGKGAEKGYLLLREAMEKSGRIGIAQVVIRTRQYLAAVVPDGNALILNLLRYPQEVVSVDEFEFPGRELKKFKVTPKELELAEQLIDGMTTPWKPEDYRDEYRDVLMKLIEKRIKSGQTEVVEETDDEEEETSSPQTLNFMEVLKKSVAKTSPRSSTKTRARSSGKKSTGTSAKSSAKVRKPAKARRPAKKKRVG